MGNYGHQLEPVFRENHDLTGLIALIADTAELDERTNAELRDSQKAMEDAKKYDVMLIGDLPFNY